MANDPRGHRYSDQDKETALNVWAFFADRKPTKTADILREEYGLDIPAKRISVWSSEYDWHRKADELYQSIAPDMFNRGKFNLVAAIEGATRSLREMVEGKRQPDKNLAAVCFGILDRTGYQPFTRKEAALSTPLASTSSAGQAPDADDLHALDIDELRAIAAGVIDTETD